MGGGLAKALIEAVPNAIFNALKEICGDKEFLYIKKNLKTDFPKVWKPDWSMAYDGTAIAAGGDSKDELVTTVAILAKIKMGRMEFSGEDFIEKTQKQVDRKVTSYPVEFNCLRMIRGTK